MRYLKIFVAVVLFYSSISAEIDVTLLVDGRSENPTQVPVGQTVTFTAQHNCTEDLTYSWDFGDGNTTTTNNVASVTYAYQSSSDFNASVLVSATTTTPPSEPPPPPPTVTISSQTYSLQQSNSGNSEKLVQTCYLQFRDGYIVDATEPNSTQIKYKVDRDNVSVKSKFTAPGKEPEDRTVSGQFQFTYNQDSLIPLSSTTEDVVLVWQDYPNTSIVCSANINRNIVSPTAFRGVLAIVPNPDYERGSRQRPQPLFFVQAFQHYLYEVYTKVSYSQSYRGKTIKTISSTSLLNYSNIPQEYRPVDWIELHRYIWGGGDTPFTAMNQSGGIVEPNTWVREINTSIWMPDRNARGQGKVDQLIYDPGSGINSPWFILTPTVTCNIQ